MTTCTNGHEIEEGKRFCGECGAPISAAEPAPTAPRPDLEAPANAGPVTRDIAAVKSNANRNFWILVAGIAVIAGIWAMASAGNDEDRSARAAAAVDTSVYVLYEIEGTTDYASMTITTPTGIQQAEPDVPLKMKTGARAGQRGLLVGPFSPGDFVSISAQNKRGHGTIVCRISTEDGDVISENASSGGYSIASCDGRAR